MRTLSNDGEPTDSSGFQWISPRFLRISKDSVGFLRVPTDFSGFDSYSDFLRNPQDGEPKDSSGFLRISKGFLRISKDSYGFLRMRTLNNDGEPKDGDFKEDFNGDFNEDFN